MVTITDEFQGPNRGFAQFMVDNEMSLSMMAEALDITPSMVSYLRGGQRAVSDGIRWKFALAFGFRKSREILGDGNHG